MSDWAEISKKLKGDYTMLISDFEKAFCEDIIKNKKKRSSIIDWTKLPYEEMYETVEGARIPVVWIDNVPVYNRDFIEMGKDEFLLNHPTPNAGSAYDNYVSEFDIIEGTDMYRYYQNKAKEEKELLYKNAELAMSLAI